MQLLLISQTTNYLKYFKPYKGMYKWSQQYRKNSGIRNLEYQNYCA